MSNGTAAAYADVIGEDAIKKFCPKQWAMLESEVEKIDNWEEIARGWGFGEASENETINAAYQTLCEAFEKKTGLTLGVACHDRSSEGDIYDSDKVDGVYWSVGGMYQLSPAGRKMRKYVSMELFTQYG